MGTAIAVLRDCSSWQLRRLATRVKDQAGAATIGDHRRCQALRDWVIRFNEEGPDLVNKSSPGAPGKLSVGHKRLLCVSWRKGRSQRWMAS